MVIIRYCEQKVFGGLKTSQSSQSWFDSFVCTH